MARKSAALRPNAFRELAWANWRELVRDPGGIFLMVGFPFLMFGLMFLLDWSTDRQVGELGQMMLPFTLLLCYWFLGFYSLAFQTVQVRQRGTLRLLGLTPLPRLTFVLAQLPARLILAASQLLIIALANYFTGFLSLQQLPGLFFGGLLGVLLIFSLAYFVGGIFQSPEAALAGPSALLPLVMFPSGLFPTDSFPMWIVQVGRYSPFTYWLDLLNHALVGTPLQHPVGLTCTVVIGTVIAVTWLTAKTFRWDQREG